MIRSLPKYVKSYISVSCGVYLDDEIVMRHEFEKVINLCEREVAISICSPKGCGKTYTLALLFALCVHTSTRCILLTLNSFKRIIEEYFKMFLMDEKKDVEVLKQLRQDMEHTVISALQQEGNETIVFVDLSRCKTNVTESSLKMKDFLDNIISLLKLTREWLYQYPVVLLLLHLMKQLNRISCSLFPSSVV